MVSLGSLQEFAFAVGIFIISLILLNALRNWIFNRDIHNLFMFQDSTPYLIFGSFVIVMAAFMSAELYVMMF